MPSLNRGGTTLFYESYGSGEPIVLIHSYGLSQEMFFPQINQLHKRYKVILIDLRGNGESGPLNVSHREIVKTQCMDLKFVLDHLGVEKAVLLGVAEGGVLAQQFALMYPDRVSAIVLSDSCSKHRAASWIGMLAAAVQAASWLMYYLPGEMFARYLKATYYRWDTAYSTIRIGLLKKRPTEWIRQRMALFRFDYSSNLTRIRVPVLCVTGDFSAEAIRRMEETAELLPDARLAILDDAFVPSNLCQPRVFNDTVMAFLEACRPAPKTGSGEVL